MNDDDDPSAPHATRVEVGAKEEVVEGDGLTCVRAALRLIVNGLPAEIAGSRNDVREVHLQVNYLDDEQSRSAKGVALDHVIMPILARALSQRKE